MADAGHQHLPQTRRLRDIAHKTRRYAISCGSVAPVLKARAASRGPRRDLPGVAARRGGSSQTPELAGGPPSDSFTGKLGLASPTDPRVVCDLVEVGAKTLAPPDHTRAKVTAKRLAEALTLQGPA